jgi:hypothetical protein
MPELLTSGRQRQLHPGDVLMISRDIKDKVTRKVRKWQFFMVVTLHKRWIVDGIRVGAPKGKEEMQVTFDDVWTIQYLEPDEWPTGIHALRMAMILKGLIPDIV